jgi:hypothetical protein
MHMKVVLIALEEIDETDGFITTLVTFERVTLSKLHISPEKWHNGQFFKKMPEARINVDKMF